MLRYTRSLKPVQSAFVRSALSRAPSRASTAYQRRNLSVSRSLYNEQLSDKTDARNIAQQEDQGHPKISAVPFHFGKEDADSRLKIAALLATATIPNLIYATILRFLPPLPESVQNFLREFGIGGNSLKHVATRAVLWPIWRFSCVVEAGAKQIEGSGRRGKVWFAVKEGSVPGHSFSPLSLLPFSTQELPDSLPQYTPSLDLTQLGRDVPITAIPFGGYTPADVLERLKNEAGRIVEWHGLKVDLLKDLDVQLLASYPIYFPLYIGEFEFDPEETGGKKTRRITIVMDAHDENADDCRLAVPRPYGGPTPDSPSYYINSPAFISDATFQLSPQTMYNRSLGGSLATALSDAFGRWLNPPAIPPYGAENENGQVDRTAAYAPPRSPLTRVEEQTTGEVDWADVRVQRWSGEERVENERWIEAGQLRFAMQAQLETMKTLESQSGTSQITTLKLNRPSSTKGRTSILPSIEKVSMTEAIAQASDDVRKSTEEWEATRPEWLKAYEARKEGKSE